MKKTTKKTGKRAKRRVATKKPTSKKGAAKKPAAKTETKPKRVSALDAAAEVLRKAAKPMTSKALINAMAEQDLWTSPAGKTPHATLYAAMLREISAKGATARFTKVDRGQFAFNPEVKK